MLNPSPLRLRHEGHGFFVLHDGGGLWYTYRVISSCGMYMTMIEREPLPVVRFIVACHQCDFTSSSPTTYLEAQQEAVDHHFQTGCTEVYVTHEGPRATIIYGYSNWEQHLPKKEQDRYADD